jgi:cytochrome c
VTSSHLRHVLMVVAAATLAGAPAHADGDAAKGAKVFNKCKACHTADKETNKVGPHLVGLFGRTAGSVEGYKYSDAMRASGIVWSAETLSIYLKTPKDMVPGTKMTFAGLKKDDDIENLIAYLEEATKKSE